MPFTPFHLGFGLLVAVLTYRWLDPMSVLVASIAVDARSVLVFFDLIGGPIHGPLHTLPGAIVVGLLVAGGAYAVRDTYLPLLDRIGYDTPASVSGFIIGGLVGAVLLHLLPDAMLYADTGLLEPFHPFLREPIAGIFSSMYVVAVMAGVAGLLISKEQVYSEIKSL